MSMSRSSSGGNVFPGHTSSSGSKRSDPNNTALSTEEAKRLLSFLDTEDTTELTNIALAAAAELTEENLAFTKTATPETASNKEEE